MGVLEAMAIVIRRRQYYIAERPPYQANGVFFVRTIVIRLPVNCYPCFVVDEGDEMS